MVGKDVDDSASTGVAGRPFWVVEGDSGQFVVVARVGMLRNGPGHGCEKFVGGMLSVLFDGGGISGWNWAKSLGLVSVSTAIETGYFCC